MERDVVFADEVNRPGVRVLPPVSPRLGVILVGGPLLCCRQVADDRLEPDVDPFPGSQVVDRYVNPPVKVAGDGPVLEALFDPALREVQDVGPPAFARIQPVPQRLLEVRQAEEEVLGLARDGFAAGDLGPWVDQLLRVEGSPAALALVAACLGVVAVRAGALDVAVGQEPLGFLVVVLVGRSLVDVALPEKAQEDVVGDRGMVVGARGGVAVPADAEALPVVDELGVVTVDDVVRRDPVGVGPNGDWCAVHIGAADHEHPVTDPPLEAGEHVGWQVGAGKVAEVARPRGVGPGHGNQDWSGHAVRRHGDRGYRCSSEPTRADQPGQSPSARR